MRPSDRPDLPAQAHPYRTQICDQLGRVAGMFEALGMGDGLDHATHPPPDLRDLTVGEAVNAMGLNGLGCITQARSLVPCFFQNQPTSRLISPRVPPTQRHDDALGRALDIPLYAAGVTELDSLIAAPAAQRLGRTPRVAPLDRTSFHVAGRSNSDEAPDQQVIHSTRGDSRDHRPALNQVMWELMAEHQAGIPVLMQPRSGNSSAAQEFGQMIREHMAQVAHHRRHDRSGGREGP
jgi:transposase